MPICCGFTIYWAAQVELVDDGELTQIEYLLDCVLNRFARYRLCAVGLDVDAHGGRLIAEISE